jgi:hypothetical protein
MYIFLNKFFYTIIALSIIIISCFGLIIDYELNGFTSSWLCTLFNTFILGIHIIIRLCVPDGYGERTVCFFLICFPFVMWCIHELINNLKMSEIMNISLTCHSILYAYSVFEIHYLCTKSVNNIVLVEPIVELIVPVEAVEPIVVPII